GTQYPIVGQIPGGTTVDARDCTDWCRVEGGGFVNGAYLVFGDDGPAPVYAGPPPVYVAPAPVIVPGPIFVPRHRYWGPRFY
ncbi:hypothetical protein NL529_32845, partial [Klebsiella pneumoniae]|nr:hypothetical protein [Klebsiella pneumoniae]